MVASQKMTKGKNSAERVKLLEYHSARLNQLNECHEKHSKIRKMIRLYKGKDKKLFKKQVGRFLNEDFGTSLKPQDVNAALYTFLSYVFLPFYNFTEVDNIIEGFSNMIMSLGDNKKDELNLFVDHIISTRFIHELQKDCLELYPEIYEAELPLRPALFLDLVEGYERNKIAARISNENFITYKDLYKDIAEVFGRQLNLVAGINNIIHRNGHNRFLKPQDGNALSSLDKFADKTLSEKFKYLDNCWYRVDNSLVDTNVRNAIAHFTAEYDECTQIITYFPDKEGIRQEKGETMFFLDFMRMLLTLFREVHNLNHLIKVVLYYEYLIRNRDMYKSEAK
jgi:hypothetical protein